MHKFCGAVRYLRDCAIWVNIILIYSNSAIAPQRRKYRAARYLHRSANYCITCAFFIIPPQLYFLYSHLLHCLRICAAARLFAMRIYFARFAQFYCFFLISHLCLLHYLRICGAAQSFALRTLFARFAHFYYFF